jgi:hypothetical protein
MHCLSTETFLTKYTLRGVLCDPTTLMVGSMALSAAGGAISASSTLAGGKYAEEAGLLAKSQSDARAKQLEMNASQSMAAGQRKMFEVQERTRALVNTNAARAGASGVDAGSGSPALNAGEIEGRGSYHALMEMFNGTSEATGLRNQAAAERYSGDIAEWEGRTKRQASKLTALGTLAATGGNMLSTYGRFRYSPPRGAAGVSL